jgi:site-specific DNA recombinase
VIDLFNHVQTNRKLAYEFFLRERRKGVVAKLLNEAGHRTRAGSKWSDTAIGRTIRCIRAKGIYYINRTRQTGNWKTEEKPESEWGVLEIDPVVSEALWNQCNQILEEQEKSRKKPGKRPVQLFAGLTYCICNQKMYVKANSPKYVCEACRNKIPVVDLEAIFHDELKAFFATPERIATHLNQAQENLVEKENLLQINQSEIQKVRDDMTRTHKLYLADQITPQGFGNFYKPAEERLNQLVAEIPKLEAEIARIEVNNLSAEEVVSEAEELYARWPKLPVDNRRNIVETIVEKIVIGKGEIDITFAYLPSSEEMIKNQLALLRR